VSGYKKANIMPPQKPCRKWVMGIIFIDWGSRCEKPIRWIRVANVDMFFWA
jgi:hypothetical protein